MRYEVYFFINLADTLPHERVGLIPFDYQGDVHKNIRHTLC